MARSVKKGPFIEAHLAKKISKAIIECSFSSDMDKLALQTKHLTPQYLFKQLKNLQRDDISLYINHMKPSFLKKIKKEISQNKGFKCINILKDEEILNF